ncbi:energy-coupling factor transporter transmembrane component T family protein [Shimia biformata]|uniref:energy-coupling factor transporter transmembrane component T family protein n=1 Tax=Shimia biformata TaxID=1294299 RepID=UPI001951FABB|nr:energy-coupling factor transporter transmembrane protein EcfT [Shimia biformata]
MLDLYSPGTSRLHRARAGWKLLALMAFGTAIFLTDTLWHVLAAGGVVVALFLLSGLTLRQAWAQVRPAIWILAILFVVQGIINSWALGAFVVARFAVLLTAAGLLTLTTRASDMIDAITFGLGFLRPVGVNPAKVGLTFSLALRFIPVLGQITQEVREAQKARGLERSLIAVALPVAIRTIKMADDVADAIDARGYRP